jgi:hypothetical protein
LRSAESGKCEDGPISLRDVCPDCTENLPYRTPVRLTSWKLAEPKKGIKKLKKLEKWSKRWNLAKIHGLHGEAMYPDLQVIRVRLTKFQANQR